MPALHSLHSRRLGLITVADGDVLEFPEGLPGLHGRHFAVIGVDGRVGWLQSVDDSELAIPVADPLRYFPSYRIEAAADALAALGGPPQRILVLIRFGAEGPTANLRAPILVRDGRALQIINELPGAPFRAPLPAPPQARAA